jgi:hypothetical protein
MPSRASKENCGVAECILVWVGTTWVPFHSLDSQGPGPPFLANRGISHHKQTKKETNKNRNNNNIIHNNNVHDDIEYWVSLLFYSYRCAGTLGRGNGRVRLCIVNAAIAVAVGLRTPHGVGRRRMAAGGRHFSVIRNEIL